MGRVCSSARHLSIGPDGGRADPTGANYGCAHARRTKPIIRGQTLPASAIVRRPPGSRNGCPVKKQESVNPAVETFVKTVTCDYVYATHVGLERVMNLRPRFPPAGTGEVVKSGRSVRILGCTQADVGAASRYRAVLPAKNALTEAALRARILASSS